MSFDITTVKFTRECFIIGAVLCSAGLKSEEQERIIGSFNENRSCWYGLCRAL